jgi:hypothetical protein
VAAILDAFETTFEGGTRLTPDTTYATSWDASGSLCVQITSPSDNSTSVVTPFSPLSFWGTATDLTAHPPATLSGGALRWSSDVDGPLGTGSGASFDFTFAPEGTRRITLTATKDATTSASVSIRFTARFAHVPPTPVITWPAPNAVRVPGTYWLTGYAPSTDPGVLNGRLPCDRLLFNNAVRAEPVPNDPSLCRAQWTWSGADVGTQVVTLSATNRLGDVGRSSTSVTIRAPQQPTLAVQISSPIPGAHYTVILGGGGTQNAALAGIASPIVPGSIVAYAWYQYPTAQGVGAKRFIGAGANFAWRIDDSVCGSDQRIHDVDLTVRLEVTDDVPSDPSRNRSGASEVPIRVTCMPPPR